MRYRIPFLLVALLAPSFAAAQSTTADGIRLLARGDAPSALRVLRPLADAPEPDPLAQFFVAALYDTGSGVTMDHVRACGLYLKSAIGTNPLASQALALADAIRRLNPNIAALCGSRSIAIWRDPAAPAFVPGPDHTVTSDATSNGIDAFVRRDYQRAAQILGPVAERWPGEVDDAAAYLMAALYRNGQGAPRDVVRACALHVRASAGTSPFARLGAAMFAALQPTLTADEEAECLMLATIGFHHRFERATFEFDTGHWIAIELSSRTQSVSATVAYQGKEKRTDVPAPLGPGVVFLPIQHTELEVGGAAPSRRHFIEILAWLPERSASRWQLCWNLVEVVREDVVPVANEFLLTAAGDAPPEALPDLRKLVSLGVNAAGAAEWAVLDGPNAHREAIETDLERQEVRAEQERRKAADERVDWKQVRDPERAPSFAYADADGCSDLFVYGWSADRTEAIAFRVDKGALELSTAPRTFDLARQPNDIALSVEVFERPQRNWPFCTDIVVNEGTRRETWRAVAGAITLQLSAPGVRAREPHRYRVTIQIDGAEFVSANGIRVRQSRPIRLVALAGGTAGG